MEFKWCLISLVAIVAMVFCGVSFESYQENQCKIEALRALADPSTIKELCTPRRY
jgi:hypothetical protein